MMREGSAQRAHWRQAKTVVSALGLLLYILVALWTQIKVNPRFVSDIEIYLHATAKTWQGGSPYQPFVIGGSFVYPPSALVLFSPLLPLPPESAKLLWATLNIVMVMSAITVVWQVLRPTGASNYLVVLAGVILLCTPLLETLTVGQIDGLILLGMALFVWGLADQRYQWVGDLSLALIIMIKITPLVLLVVPLARGDWRRIIRVLAGMGGLFASSILLFGLRTWFEFMQILPELFRSHPSIYNQSLMLSITRLFAHTPVDAEVTAWLSRIFSIVVLGLWVGIVIRHRKKINPIAMAILGIVALTISPSIIWHHHLLFLTIPLVYLILGPRIGGPDWAPILGWSALGLIQVDRLVEIQLGVPPLTAVAGYLLVFLGMIAVVIREATLPERTVVSIANASESFSLPVEKYGAHRPALDLDADVRWGSPSGSWKEKTAWWSWLALGLLGAGQAVLHWQFLPMVAGVDSILVPWLINQGFALYTDIIDQHGPVYHYLLALGLYVVPDPLVLFKLAAAITPVLTTWLLFAAGKRIWGTRMAWTAILFFVMWEVIFNYRAFYFEPLLGILYLLAFFLWHTTNPSGSSKRRVFLAGLILGLSFLVKQHGGFAVIGYVAWRLLIGAARQQSVRQIALDLAFFIGGAALLPLAALGYYAVTQRLTEFVYWTWTFNFTTYTGQATQLPRQWELTILLRVYLFLLPFAIYAVVFYLRRSRDFEQTTLLLIWVLVSSTAAFPRFALFHLGPSLPFLALIAAHVIHSAIEWATARSPSLTWRDRLSLRSRRFLVSSSLGVILLFNLFQAGEWYRYYLEGGQFIAEYEDLVPIAQWVQNNTAAAEIIYIYPDTEAAANIYAISNRLPPGMWTCIYPWFRSSPGMLDRLITHLEYHKPRLVIYFPHQSWQWLPLAEYIHAHYTKMMTLPGDGKPDGVWIMQRQIGQPQIDMPAGPLQGSITMGQTFHSPYPGLYRIDTALATYARLNTHDVIFHLRESPSTTVDLATIVVNAREIEDNAWHRFEFTPLAGSADRTFYFFLESPTSTPDDAITIYGLARDDYKEGRAYLNGQPAGGDLAFLTYYQVTPDSVSLKQRDRAPACDGIFME